MNDKIEKSKRIFHKETVVLDFDEIRLELRKPTYTDVITGEVQGHVGEVVGDSTFVL